MKIKCSKCGQIYSIDTSCSCSSFADAVASDRAILPKYTHSSGQRYIFKKKLGSGGNGEVWEFEDTTLVRAVAVKVPLESMQNDIILQEARVGGLLEHPNILPVYDIGVSNNRSCFVMRKFEEKSNFSGLKGQSEVEVLQKFLQVCHGVDYAHSQKIIHFDLKPENILLGYHGEVVIVDWGLSAHISDIKTKFSTGVIVGTPQYMSPEQASGNPEKYGIFCDIYSLGMTLYTTIVAKKLFSGLSVRETLSKISSSEKGVVPVKKPRGISMQLYNIIKKATAHNIQERYLSVSQLIQDVESYLKREDGIAFKQSMFTKIYLMSKKYPRFFASIVLLLLFFFTTFYFVRSRYLEAQSQALNALKSNQISQAAQAYTIANSIFPWSTAQNDKHILEQYILLQKELDEMRFAFFFINYSKKNIEDGSLTMGHDPQVICKKLQKRLDYITLLLYKCNVAVQEFMDSQLLSHRRAEIIFMQEASSLKNNESINSIFERILAKYEIQADPYLSLALAFSNKNWNAIEKATDSEPDFYWGYLLRSIHFKRQEKLEQSKLAITPCIVLKPQNPLPYFVLSSFTRDEKNLSLEYLHKAQQIAPNDAMVDFHMGNLYYHHGEFSKALEYYDRVIELEPEFFGGYNNRGYTWLHQKNSVNAMRDFEKALKLLPNLLKPYNGIGQVYRLEKKWEKALKNYEKALKIEPDYEALYYNNCGNVYFDQQQYQRALEYYQKSLSLDKKLVDAYFNLGIVYDRLGQKKLAIDAHTKAIKLDKKYLASYLERAVLYKQQKMFSKAKKDYNFALNLTPNNIRIYYNRAILYEEIGDIKNALLDYKKVIQLDAQHFKACYNYAFLQYKQSKFSKALVYIDKAIKLDSSIPHFFYLRAQIYAALNKIPDATSDYLKVIELEKNYPQANYALARIYAMNNEPEQACYYVEKCIQINENYRGLIHQDRFFEAIRNYPLYKKIMDIK